MLAGARPGGWADEELPPCGSTVMTECVISVKREGVVQDYPSDGDPLNISIRSVGPGSARLRRQHHGIDGAPLPMGQEWEIAVNTGSTFPGETFSRGREVSSARGGTAGSRTVAITATGTSRPGSAISRM